MPLTTRLATFNDIHVLQQLIAASVRGLSKGYYTHEQIESAIKYIFGVDTQLLTDGTYYVAEANGNIIACGGWSKRRTLYGDAARIRAFFVHPGWARQGIGRMMIDLCEQAAIRNGFKAMELGATLPGEPLYKALGYISVEKLLADMPDGTQLQIVKMHKQLV